MLKTLLAEKRDTICESWRELIFASYPERSSRFFGREKGQFSNPVGQTVTAATTAIVDALINAAEAGDLDAAQVKPHLDRVIKIRSIQDFTPSEAVFFVYQLRDVLREHLSSASREPAVAAALRELEDRQLVTLALWAFDSYVSCREKLYDVRVSELKRSVYTLRRRFGELDPQQETAAQAAASPPALARDGPHGNGT